MQNKLAPKGCVQVWAGEACPKLRFHDLRHTCASHLAKTSKNLLVVQKQLGHADIKTTMKYAHLADETHREEVERLAGEIFG